MTETRYGFKFLDPTGATYYNGIETVYPLPAPGEKWGPEFVHPNPAEPDGKDCGPGRWHVMKRPSADHAPDSWWPWYVQSTGVIVGESKKKFGTTALRLRRISQKAWHRIIRMGWCSSANLSGANLFKANLHKANLYGANLSWANLYGANLSGADLYGANLYVANLYGADLFRANLSGANLFRSNLFGAYLSGANLSGANLHKADLSWANLSGANLSDANLSGADLYKANLSGARYDEYTRFPSGFDMSRLEVVDE